MELVDYIKWLENRVRDCNWRAQQTNSPIERGRFASQASAYSNALEKARTVVVNGKQVLELKEPLSFGTLESS